MALALDPRCARCSPRRGRRLLGGASLDLKRPRVVGAGGPRVERPGRGRGGRGQARPSERPSWWGTWTQALPMDGSAWSGSPSRRAGRPRRGAEGPNPPPSPGAGGRAGPGRGLDLPTECPDRDSGPGPAPPARPPGHAAGGRLHDGQRHAHWLGVEGRDGRLDLPRVSPSAPTSSSRRLAQGRAAEEVAQWPRGRGHRRGPARVPASPVIRAARTGRRRPQRPGHRARPCPPQGEAASARRWEVDHSASRPRGRGPRSAPKQDAFESRPSGSRASSSLMSWPPWSAMVPRSPPGVVALRPRRVGGRGPVEYPAEDSAGACGSRRRRASGAPRRTPWPRDVDAGSPGGEPPPLEPDAARPEVVRLRADHGARGELHGRPPRHGRAAHHAPRGFGPRRRGEPPRGRLGRGHGAAPEGERDGEAAGRVAGGPASLPGAGRHGLRGGPDHRPARRGQTRLDRRLAMSDADDGLAAIERVEVEVGEDVVAWRSRAPAACVAGWTTHGASAADRRPSPTRAPPARGGATTPAAGPRRRTQRRAAPFTPRCSSQLDLELEQPAISDSNPTTPVKIGPVTITAGLWRRRRRVRGHHGRTVRPAGVLRLAADGRLEAGARFIGRRQRQA